MSSSAERLRVLSLIPGRMRLHLPGWTARDLDEIEDRLGRVQGVKSVRANRLTGNVLIHFDPRTTDEQALLVDLPKMWHGLFAVQAHRAMAAPREGIGQPVQGRGPVTSPLVRVGVRGVLGHAAVDSVWFGVGFLGEALGLPFAGLGSLHVLADVAVWGVALASGRG